MRDFLGQEYGPGDLVVYGAMSGRCVNMVVGRVVEIFDVYDSRDTYKWERLPEGELPPFTRKYGWLDAEGNVHPERGDGLKWSEYETSERVKAHPRVRIQPLRGARWEQHSSKTYWVDTRTGKRIDPTRTDKHTAVPAHYEYADGTYFDYVTKQAEYEKQLGDGFRYNRHKPYSWHFYDNYHVNRGEVGQWAIDYRTDEEKAKVQLWRIPRAYKDYVEERTEGPKPVLIEVTENIVKFNGELPAEEDA